VVGVHPPVAFTSLRDKMLVGGRWMKPFLKLIMKTPVQAAQTTIFAAVDPSVVSGQMYRSVVMRLSQYVVLYSVIMLWLLVAHASSLACGLSLQTVV